MDRNKYVVQCRKVLGVALRKESVDRNTIRCSGQNTPNIVALRKESVDRNTSIDNLTQGVFKSLSARRAWIEMLSRLVVGCLSMRRSPQGERG